MGLLRLACFVLAAALVFAGGDARAQERADPARDILATYALGAGDSVRITVYQEPELTGVYAVGPDGAISMPLLGTVDAAGRTTSELARVIADRLSDGFLQGANVAAEIAAFRPYYIYGEVENAGEYPYAAGMNVLRAVAAAGGYTYRAKKSHVFILRPGEPEELKVRVGREAIVMPGDVIRVPERFF